MKTFRTTWVLRVQVVGDQFKEDMRLACSLQDPITGQVHYFASLENALSFVRTRISEVLAHSSAR